MAPRRKKLILASLALAPVLAVAAVLAADWWVGKKSDGRLIGDIAQLPPNDVALVLGTSPFSSRSGRANPFFEGRMNTAARLYREGKVRHLLVSGDNSRDGYDEPTWMRDALIERGVPESAITRDYAGFRTLDSMARARAVFGLERVTIVTDDFHQPRALFLAEAEGLDAVGFASEHVPDRWSKKTRLREHGSRVKACLDIYLLRTKPRFLGPPVEIQIANR